MQCCLMGMYIYNWKMDYYQIFVYKCIFGYPWNSVYTEFSSTSEFMSTEHIFFSNLWIYIPKPNLT